jgi:hypothetical protein
MTNLEQLQYPIGKFKKGLNYTPSDVKKNIESFPAFPEQLGSLVKSRERETETQPNNQ